MTLITDIDGVLIDMLSPVRDAYGIKDTDVTQWGLQEVLGVDDGEYERLWTLIWDTSLYPYPSALPFLHTAKNYGEVSGLSHRLPGVAGDAAIRDFKQLDISCWLVDRPEGKLDYLRKYPWDLYLDDCLLNVIHAGEEFGKDKVLLLDRPWNQSLDVGRLYTRVDGYNEVLEIVRENSRVDDPIAYPGDNYMDDIDARDYGADL